MKLEASLKHFSPQGMHISDDVKGTSPDRITGTDVMAAIGIHPCLAVVSRKHMDGWTPVFNSGHLMFDDIDLLTMLQLVARVVADSLGNFLPVSPTSATPGQPQS